MSVPSLELFRTTHGFPRGRVPPGGMRPGRARSLFDFGARVERAAILKRNQSEFAALTRQPSIDEVQTCWRLRTALDGVNDLLRRLDQLIGERGIVGGDLRPHFVLEGLELIHARPSIA